MNNGVQRNTPVSDYVSDYDSPTSQAEYNGIDNKQSNIQINYNNHIDGILRGLPGSGTSSEVSISSPSSNQTSSDNEVSSTNLLDENNPQKKKENLQIWIQARITHLMIKNLKVKIQERSRIKNHS